MHTTLKRFLPGLLLALAACGTTPAIWAESTICTGTESVRIEEAEGIFPPASVQVPGPDITTPAAHLEWNYLGETSNKLTAHCYAKLLDAQPFKSVDITGKKSCSYDGGTTKTLTCK